MADQYRLHTLQLHADSMGAAVNLPDVTSQSISNNINVRKIIAAGFSSPTHAAYVNATVMHSLQCYCLKTALDEVGATGLAIDSDTNPGAIVYLEKHDDNGQPAAGSVHRSMTIAKGLIYPQSLEVDHQGDAVLNLGLAIVQKSTTDVIVISDVAALPTISIAAATWTLGKITIAGYVVPDYMRLRIDFGNDVQPGSTKSNVWPDRIKVNTHAPRIEVTVEDPRVLDAANIDIGGVAAAHADTIVYCRKRATTPAQFVTDVTAEHIKFTMAGLAAVDDPLSAAQVQRPTETTIVVEGVIDGSGNNPLIINTASAIT